MAVGTSEHDRIAGALDFTPSHPPSPRGHNTTTSPHGRIININGVILDVSLVNGFVPAASDTLTIVIANNVNGLFGNATDSKIEVAGFGVFDVTVGSDKVVLSHFTAAVPEPSHAGLLLSATLALLPGRRRSWNG